MQEVRGNNYKNYLIRWYFYITPIFIVLDYCLGLNVRVAVLDSMPMYKNLYYGFCVLCGVSMFIIPRYSAVVALFESIVNLMMLVFGIFSQYIRTITTFIDNVLGADFKAIEDSLRTESMVNLAIVAFCLILTFRASVDTIAGSFKFNPSDMD